MRERKTTSGSCRRSLPVHDLYGSFCRLSSYWVNSRYPFFECLFTFFSDALVQCFIFPFLQASFQAITLGLHFASSLFIILLLLVSVKACRHWSSACDIYCFALVTLVRLVGFVCKYSACRCRRVFLNGSLFRCYVTWCIRPKRVRLGVLQEARASSGFSRGSQHFLLCLSRPLGRPCFVLYRIHLDLVL